MKSKQQLKAAALIEEAQTIIDRAEAEDRDRTDEETTRVEGLLARAKRLDADAKAAEQIAEIGRGIGPGPDANVHTDSVGGGWGKLAKALQGKQNHIEVPTETLLTGAKRIQATGKDLTWSADFVEGIPVQLPGTMQLGRDERWVHAHLQRQHVTGQLSVQDYRQTGSRVVTGDVERAAVTSTAAKAELDVEIDYVVQELGQVAVLISGVPNALLRAPGASLQAFLTSEAQFQLSAATDAHVVNALLTATHDSSAEGATLVERIRRGIGLHRAAGYNPSILVVDPETSADLDLVSFADGYQFNVSRYGASSPLFSVTVIETASPRSLRSSRCRPTTSTAGPQRPDPPPALRPHRAVQARRHPPLAGGRGARQRT